MKRTARIWISTQLLLLAASLHATPPVILQVRPNEERQITVRLRNYAQVESAVLASAETTASKILHEAGTETVWVLCFDGTTWSGEMACTSQPGPMDLTLNVLPFSMSQAFQRRGDVFGHASEGSDQAFGCTAWIFFDSIKSFATERELSLAPLLGHALAHELGHLLMGANSHSGVGLMSAHWSSRELLAANQGGLFFSASESRRLEKAALARWQAASHGVQSAEVQQVIKNRLVLEPR